MASKKTPSSRGPRDKARSPRTSKPTGGRPARGGPARDDDRKRRPPRDDDRKRRPPRDDDRSRRPPRDDDRSRRPPRDDDRSRRPPRDDDRKRRPPRDDDRRPPRDHEGERPPPRSARKNEERLHGVRAVRAVFDRRPQDVLRVWITTERKRELAELLSFCAANKLPFHVTDTDEVAKVSAVQRHEGVCIEANKPKVPTLDEVLADMKTRSSALFVALEDVGDPHNVGAIVRVCAHFGVSAVLGLGRTARRNPALVRTAEGGAESVPVIPIEKPMDALRRVRRAGFTLVGTSPHAERSLYDVELPRRTVFVLGAERSGLSEAVVGSCDEYVAIPGSGGVESLNVSCASSVLLAEAWRRRPAGVKAR
jgi:TrmH RNA methyltransferase